MQDDDLTAEEKLKKLDRAWAQTERGLHVVFQERDAATGKIVRTMRAPRADDGGAFRKWALAFAGMGAVAGFAVKLADPKGAVLAIGAGFALFTFVAAIYAWLYARSIEKKAARYALGKAEYEAARAPLLAEVAPAKPRKKTAAAAAVPGAFGKSKRR